MEVKVLKNEYEDFFVDFYDILSPEVPELDLYTKLSEKYGNKVLELGSGTGRILIPLYKRGIDIKGLELNEPMKNRAIEKLANEGIEERLIYSGNMCDFHIDEKFDLIISSFDLINHLVERSDFENMVDSVRKHLNDKGVFVIDNSLINTEIMKNIHGVEEVFEFIHPVKNTKIIDKFKACYDFDKRIETSFIELIEYDKDIICNHVKTVETKKIYTKEEMKEIVLSRKMKVVEEKSNDNAVLLIFSKAD